jgi:putative ABC transport system permease protein
MSFVSIGAQIGVLYGPLALGIFLSFRVLSLPDLTLEGSFGIGGAATAASMAHGTAPALALAIGMAGGAVAGLTTALLHRHLQLNVLLASIVVTTASWSVALKIMGGGNVSLLSESSVFAWGQDLGLTPDMATLLVGGGATLIAGGLLAWFLHTEYGLSLRAAGLNIQTARGMGVRTEGRQTVGLMIANALAAASGGLVVQNEGFMDVSISIGTVVVGLAALMIGQAVIRSPRPIPAIASVLLGILIYRIVVAWTLARGMDPNYVKFVTAAVVVLVVAFRTEGRGLISARGSLAARRRARSQFYEHDVVAPFL